MGRQSFEKDTMALVLASNQGPFLSIGLGVLYLRVGKDEVLEAAVPDQVSMTAMHRPMLQMPMRRILRVCFSGAEVAHLRAIRLETFILYGCVYMS